MERNTNIVSEGRFVMRNRIVRSVGLDSDVLIALIDDSEQFSTLKPQIYSRKNALHINYVVFSEMFGYFVHQLKYSPEEAKHKIFSFLRGHRIRLIKKSEIDLNKVELIFDSLKNQRAIMKNTAGDKDLKIISVYKAHEIDCIIGRNSLHFKPFCRYLNIEFEKIREDIDMMWKDTFGWRKRR